MNVVFVMDKFSNLPSPKIRNFVSSCKRFVCGGMGPMDSIMALKDYSGFKFTHENKRVENWTTMASHVYDSKYCKVMIVAIFDLQSKDAEA